MLDYMLVLIKENMISEVNYSILNKNNRCITLTGHNGVQYQTQGDAALSLYNYILTSKF